jgi:uncharacterized membrane protein YphA (DoxX/SURF4 family)
MIERSDATDTSDVAVQWAMRISVALIFTLTGVEKFLPGTAPSWIRIFDAIGLGQWFRYFTGIIEVVGGLLFLVPVTTVAGAAILITTMVGAMATQAFVLNHPADGIFPALYLVGVVVVYLKLRARRRVADRNTPREKD